MNDRQIRFSLLIFFTIILWAIYPGSDDPLVIFPVLSLPLTLSYVLPWFMNFIASALVFPHHSDFSYENQFYKDDMDKAHRLVREEKWNKAIAAYRNIIQKTPKMCEPRFKLARIYEKEGYLGLALSEYKKIIHSKDELRSNNALLMESERAIEELTNKLSTTKSGIQ